MNMTNFKRFTLVLGVLIAVLLMAGCGAGDDSAEPSEDEFNGANPGYEFDGTNPIVQIEMQDGGKMVFELYYEYAPETVANFVNLVNSGFYDGLTFHRIVENFVIQGGDPNGDGTGGSENNITGEFAANGFEQNTLKHTKGVISMARSQHPDSASSQFFIMHGDVPSLDGSYAAFGKMIEGEETLDSIVEETPTSQNPWTGEMSDPLEDVIMERVTVMDSNN